MNGTAGPPGVKAAATLVPVVPLGLLAWQIGWIVAAATRGELNDVALAVATGAAAALGGWTGVQRPERMRPLVWRAATRLLRILALLAAVVAVRLVSPDLSTALAQLSRGSILTAAAITALVVVVLIFLVGRTIGRVYRRQADPLAESKQHRSAEGDLLILVLVGAGVTVVLNFVAVQAGAVPTSGSWLPLLHVSSGVLAIALARKSVLHARAGGTAPAPSARAWRRSLAPLIGATTLPIVLAGIILYAGGEAWLADVLPTGRPLAIEPLGPTNEVPPPELGRDPPGFRPLPAAALWQVALLIGLLYVLAAWPGRRSRGLVPAVPLLVSLRELFQLFRRQGTDDANDELAIPDAADNEDASVIPTSLRLLARRLRPRPRDPARAILYDYRAVQRHLPEPQRRRPPETVLTNAARSAYDELHELAQLVSATRYASWQPTAADADRSRELARRLLRRH